jgi:hypothetical protein
MIYWPPVILTLVISGALLGLLMVVIHRSHASNRGAVAHETSFEADRSAAATSTAIPFSTPVVEVEQAPFAKPAPEPPAPSPEPPPAHADHPGTGPLAAADPAPPARISSSAPAEPAACSVDHRYGTSVDFVDSPTEAGEQALKEKKLLFVLHVAGNFEKDQFT